MAVMMSTRPIRKTPPAARVGWTLSRRIQLFGSRKLLDLSLDEARMLHAALGRAIDQADALPGRRAVGMDVPRRPR